MTNVEIPFDLLEMHLIFFFEPQDLIIEMGNLGLHLGVIHPSTLAKSC